ncbi:porin [uncultured Shewanella sp.]|uniref:porin n=1 Tax=uncultured Shewanella sp. TaxID=173975 RepID=UPI00260E80E5|nr:porin [uncultured Shewanella sp.]
MNAFHKTLLASTLASLTLASAQAAETTQNNKQDVTTDINVNSDRGNTMQSQQALDSAVILYGKLNITGQYNDEDGETKNTIQSNESRLGVKGGYQITDALEAFYTIEYKVDTGADSSDNFTARNQFVGLRGSFGELAVGRNDTIFKRSEGKVDQFNDLDGDIKYLFKGQNRMAQTATYLTPDMKGFRIGATYVADADSNQYDENGYSVAAFYGDKKLKKTMFYASVAYDDNVKGYEIIRGTAQVKIMELKLGAMYQQQKEKYDEIEVTIDGETFEQIIAVDGDRNNGYLLSAAYPVKDFTLKAQYQDMEEVGESWAAGVDYQLAKPTKLMAFWIDRTYDTAYTGSSEETDKYFAVGIEHKF